MSRKRSAAASGTGTLENAKEPAVCGAGPEADMPAKGVRSEVCRYIYIYGILAHSAEHGRVSTVCVVAGRKCGANPEATMLFSLWQTLRASTGHRSHDASHLLVHCVSLDPDKDEPLRHHAEKAHSKTK